MKKLVVISVISLLLLCASFLPYGLPQSMPMFLSYNTNYPPPASYHHPFSLSQDYPVDYNKQEEFPWKKVEFKNDPKRYLNTLLHYCLEGNTEINFDVQRNSVRKWFHSPWLHDDGKYSAGGKYIGNGREFIHGLTRERFSPAYELHANQNTDLETWAIGFYNERGGYTLKKVWRSGSVPNSQLSEFPEGTVAFKLLFTDGSTDKVPFLKGSLEWTANIYPRNPLKLVESEIKRVNRTVRLLQIDIAVKDNRAKSTGWVFGTFIYNGHSNGKTIWNRMVPVGLSWGDDSDVKDMILTKGAYLNSKLRECYINKDVLEPATIKNVNVAYMRHLGLGGRLNGPVDNPASSCISCHSRAANDVNGVAASFGKLGKEGTFSDDEFREYFQTFAAGTGKMVQRGVNFTRTDYSMQVAIGIRNYYACRTASR
jgi:hypothetical protein